MQKYSFIFVNMKADKSLSRWSKFCAWALRKWGWTVDGEVARDKVAVLLAVPHTSILDFLVCYLYYTSLGATPHALVKKELFFWPLGPALLKMGGIPLDRKNPVATIKGTIDKMKNSDEVFHLAIAPEGTRKAVSRWKTGYHTIARALDAPVYLGHIDWGTRHIGYTESYPLTDDIRKDTEGIQAYYASHSYQGRHPELFKTK